MQAVDDQAATFEEHLTAAEDATADCVASRQVSFRTARREDLEAAAAAQHERDQAISMAATAWDLLGRPERYRSRIEELPGVHRWLTKLNVDPETVAEFESLVERDPGPTRATPTSTDTDRRAIPGGAFVYGIPETLPAIWGTGDEILWAEGEAFMIAGPTGVGKSTLIAQLVAARLGIVSDVLGHRVQRATRPVLYLAMDRPTQIRRLLHRLFTNYDARDALDRELIVWQGPLPATLNADPTVLVRTATDLGAGTVILDSLKDAAVKLTDDEAGGNINRAFQLVTSEGIELAVLHHQRKAPSDSARAPKGVDEIYGSALIVAGMGSVIALHGQPGDPIVDLLHLKQPLEQVGPLKIEHDNQTGLSSVHRGFDPLAYLANRGSTGATAKQTAVAMFETQAPDASQVAKARRKLDNLHKRIPETVQRVDVSKGGDGGTAPVRWVHRASTGASTHEVQP